MPLSPFSPDLPPRGHLRDWTVTHLQGLFDTHGRWTPAQHEALYVALREVIEAVAWSPAQRVHLEDVFQAKAIVFFRDFRCNVCEREKLTKMVGKERKTVTVFEKDDNGRELRDVNGREIPKLVEPPVLLSPPDFANRFIAAVRRGIEDVLRREAGQDQA